MSVYRKSEGEDIDSLRQRISELEKENSSLKSKKLWRLKAEILFLRIKKIDWGKLAFRVFIGLLLLGVVWLAAHINSCHNEADEHNEKVRDLTFKAAYKWNDKFGGKEGQARCEFGTAPRDGDWRPSQRLRMEGLINCYIYLQDKGMVHLIECDPGAQQCFKRSPQ